MKTLILSFFVLAAFSCRKVYVTNVLPVKHDTSFVIIPSNSLIGSWETTSTIYYFKDLHPVFGVDTVFLSGQSYSYTAAGDTIYKFYDYKTLEAMYYYQLNGDSLTLLPTFCMCIPATFYRTH